MHLRRPNQAKEREDLVYIYNVHRLNLFLMCLVEPDSQILHQLRTL